MARRGHVGKILVALLVVTAGLSVIALGTEGRLQLPREGKPVCERTTSFLSDWTNRESMRASTIDWGVIGSTSRESLVRAPFQKLNVYLPCGAGVRLVVEFKQIPRGLSCRIIVGGKTFNPTVPSDKLGRRCVVETTVPA